ncbi:hypothetical protein HHI36_005690, partial [Cryptolaemus montrouzieri]
VSCDSFPVERKSIINSFLDLSTTAKKDTNHDVPPLTNTFRELVKTYWLRPCLTYLQIDRYITLVCSFLKSTLMILHVQLRIDDEIFI